MLYIFIANLAKFDHNKSRTYHNLQKENDYFHPTTNTERNDLAYTLSILVIS